MTYARTTAAALATTIAPTAQPLTPAPTAIVSQQTATYHDDDQRAEWITMRGLDSWRAADKWEERGTEQLADIVAFGLFDEWHTPTSIAPNDRKSLISAFEWLFGVEPLSLQDDDDGPSVD